MNLNLDIDTYEDIDDISPKELLTRFERDFGFSSKSDYSLYKQYLLMNNICSWIGIEPCNEQIMFMMANNKRVLCEAVAGSGKTTISQLIIIRNKILEDIKGYDILCIAYNEHAVKDMIRRHSELVDTINGKKVKGLHLDKEIICKTFHSYCLMWVDQFKSSINVGNVGRSLDIMSNSEQTIYMKKAITIAAKGADINITGKVDRLTNNFITFYSSSRETMTAPKDYNKLTQFSDLYPLQDLALVSKIINNYERVKSVKKRYDFTDILTYMLRILQECPEEGEQIRRAYKYVTVDEYQDFTKLMREILKLMVSSDVNLTCVGDGDQSIYSFRGTDSLNCVRFRDDYDKTLVVSMSKNRRCSEAIVDVGREVIMRNRIRNNKKIKSVIKGGQVNNIMYTDLASQYTTILDELKTKGNDLRDICITYRNKESSHLLTNMLLEEGIPFTLGSGFQPYQDLLDITMMGVCEILRSPGNKIALSGHLFKLLPGIRAKECRDLVNSAPPETDFWDLPFTSSMRKVAKFEDALAFLKQAHLALRGGHSMSLFMKDVIKVVKVYYWNYQKKQRSYSDELEVKVLGQYTKEINFSEFMRNKLGTMDSLSRAERNGNGVYLTTFHGLKGLEFDEVYAIDLADDIFPAYSSVDQNRSYNELDKELIKQESNCLMYVVSTRAKKKVTYMWDKKNPSVYYDDVIKAIGGKKETHIDDFSEYEVEDNIDELLHFGKPEIEEEEEFAVDDNIDDLLSLGKEEEFTIDEDIGDLLNFGSDKDLALEETNMFNTMKRVNYDEPPKPVTAKSTLNKMLGAIRSR